MSNPKQFQIFTSITVIDNTDTLDVGSISSDGEIVYRNKQMKPSLYECSGNSAEEALLRAVESLVLVLASSRAGAKEPSESFEKEIKLRLASELSK